MLVHALALAAAQAVTEAYEFVNPDLIRAHVEYLAADALEGRAAGQRGGELAARYIAAQFRRFRLQPAGENGTYFQEIPLALAIGDEGSALTYEGTKGTVRLGPGSALLVGGACLGAVMLEGPLTYVGYAISAPREEYDDLAGADLNGKIALALWGYPPELGERPGILLGADPGLKAATARARGARALVIVASEASGGLPRGGSTRVAPAAWDAPGWDAPDAIVSDSAFRAIAKAAERNPDSLRAAAQRGEAAAVELGGTMRLAKHPRSVTARSWNVIGIAPGSDPRIRHEAIVFVAGYESLGIGPRVNGDSIYNGAVSSAVGTAKLLAVAEAFGAHPGGRTVVFVASGGGSVGGSVGGAPSHLGMWRYVTQPAWPLPLTVAAIGVDGGLDIFGLTQDVTAPGSELSTVHEVVQRAARIMALRLAADRPADGTGPGDLPPLPLLMAGIPAVTVAPGVTFSGKPKGWGAEMRRRFFSQDYQGPSDDIRRDFEYRGPVGTAQAAYVLGRILADRAEKPTWVGEPPLGHVRGAQPVTCPAATP